MAVLNSVKGGKKTIQEAVAGKWLEVGNLLPIWQQHEDRGYAFYLSIYSN